MAEKFYEVESNDPFFDDLEATYTEKVPSGAGKYVVKVNHDKAPRWKADAKVKNPRPVSKAEAATLSGGKLGV